MNLKTEYLGLKLRTPLVPSASPLSEGLDQIRRMEDAGAAAIVMHSLFEEHISSASEQTPSKSHEEADGYWPESNVPAVGPESYLEEILAAKQAVAIPIIASLNGTTLGGWTAYAKYIEEAGADAIELNIYWIPTDPKITATEVESRYKEIVTQVKATVSIPIAVKLNPYFSNIANMAKQLSDSGAKGLVLFNRFYQPDINLKMFDVVPNIILSTSMDMRLPLRWISILRDRVKIDLAATSGIHRATDVVKLLLAGADVTMLCSVLLRYGVSHLSEIERELQQWLEKNNYESVEQLKGAMSQAKCPDPSAFERAQYVRGVSTSWRVAGPI